jgi:DNA-binding NtrC family response regulator
VLTRAGLIKPSLFRFPAQSGDQDEADGIRVGLTVADMEKQLILKTLEHCNQNRTKAAEILGISIRTLRNKINEYGECMA